MVRLPHFSYVLWLLVRFRTPAAVSAKGDSGIHRHADPDRPDVLSLGLWAVAAPLPDTVKRELQTLVDRGLVSCERPLMVHCMSSDCLEDLEHFDGQGGCKPFQGAQLNVLRSSAGTPLAEFFREHTWYKLRLGRAYAYLMQELSLWTFGLGALQSARKEFGDAAPPVVMLDLLQLDAEAVERATSNRSSLIDLGQSQRSCSRPAMVQLRVRDEEFLHELLTQYSTLLPQWAVPGVLGGHAGGWSIASCQRRLSLLEAAAGGSKSPVGIVGVASVEHKLQPPKLQMGVLQHRRSVEHAGRADLVDEVQTLPGAQLAPYVWDFVDRDELSVPAQAGAGKLTLLMNGWLGDKLPSWPLAPSLDPVLTSISISKDGEGKLSDKGFKEFLEHQDAVGARDARTLSVLRRFGVRSYLSSCITLLLQNPLPASQQHQGPLLLDDLPAEVERAVLPHGLAEAADRLGGKALNSSEVVANQHLRIDMAYGLLRKVAKASLVVTTQLHTALLCAAVDTPVVFIQDQSSSNLPYSLEGHSELFHTARFSHGQGVSGLEGFDWSSPKPNPGGHLRDRYRASFWDTVRRHRSLRDAARTYGLVPFRRSEPPAAAAEPMTFSFIQSTRADSLDKEQQRALESVFYHHPDARVNFYIMDGNEVPKLRERLAPFMESGYDVSVRGYDLRRDCLDRFKKESGEARNISEAFLENLHVFETGTEWTGHFTDLARVCILYYDGGVYLDTDILLLKPFDDKYRNVIGIMKHHKDKTDVNCAVMKFDAGNKFVRSCIVDFISRYSNATMKCWTCGGPATVTRALEARNFTNSSDVTILEPIAFYPIYWNVARELMWRKPLSDPEVAEVAKDIEERSVTLHFWRHISNHRNGDAPDSLALTLLKKYCIFCNRRLF